MYVCMLPYKSPNLKSVLDQLNIARIKLRKECDAGRIVGPFRTPHFANFRISPLGVVLKKGPSEFRLIHHLSYLKGNSVNDAIQQASYRYEFSPSYNKLVITCKPRILAWMHSFVLVFCKGVLFHLF